MFKKTLALRLGLRDSRVQVIFVFAFINELTRTQSLLLIRAAINGKDLASSRCIKGMKKNPSSQAPLRASIFLSIFLCEIKWRLDTNQEFTCFPEQSFKIGKSCQVKRSQESF